MFFRIVTSFFILMVLVFVTLGNHEAVEKAVLFAILTMLITLDYELHQIKKQRGEPP